MKKRPLIALTCIYSLGIMYGQFFSWVSISILMLLVPVCFVLFALKRQNLYLLSALAIVVFSFGAVYSYYKSALPSTRFEPFSNQRVYFEARVVSPPDVRENKTSYVVDVKRISNNKKAVNINSRALLSVYGPEHSKKLYRYGDIIKGAGKSMMPSRARNAGAFDYRRFLSSQNIYSSIITFPSDIMSPGQGDINPLIRFSLYLRDRIISMVDLSLPAEHAGLLKGLVIGERSGLSEEVKQNFNDSGLTHILCVSGANVAYIAGACIFLLGILRVGQPLSNLITMAVLVLFVLITGSSPPVVRAGIMGMMLLSAGIFQRKSDALNSISAACLAILLFNPLCIYDIGFQLSFAGTTGIVLFYKRLANFFSFLPRVINDVMSVSLAAQLTVNPIVALYFNKISLIAIISNIVVVPVTGIVTIIGFVMSIAGQVSIFISQLLGGLNYFFLSFMLWVSEVSSSLPFASIQVITPSLLFILFYYTVLYALLKYIPFKKPGPHFPKISYIAAAAAVIFLLISYSLPRPLEITFLDIGQGDCTIIKTPSGKTCLIDGGGTYPGSMGNFDPGSTIIPFLLDNGSSSVDLAMLSHPHGDHIQGLISVVKTLRVKQLVMGPQFQPNADLDSLIKLCSQRKTKIYIVSKGDRLSIDGTEFQVLHPGDENLFGRDSILNNNSTVIRLVYRNTSILFTGDIETNAERHILGSISHLDSDILKVAHHGSKNSTSLDFLKAISPSVCIVSTGKNNFGHPSPETINRIELSGSRLYRTDLDGGINIKVYKNRFKVIPAISR